MRVLLFGGSFDPPHYGHLLVARDLYERGLFDEIRFLVAYSPPHKKPKASYYDRIRMVNLLLAGEEGMRVDTYEGELGLKPSYTYDVLKAYVHRLKTKPFFLVGADSFSRMTTWKNWEELPKLADFVVIQRGGSELRTDLIEFFRPMVVSTRRLEISSSEIRERILQGKSIKGFTSDEVVDYIYSKGLYVGHDVVVYTDASAVGNPGVLKTAFVVLKGNRPVYRSVRVLPKGTNNQGEYLALIEALEYLRSAGIEEATIFMDSKLVLEQIRGRYSVRSPKLLPLWEKVKALLTPSYKLEYVNREQNLADQVIRSTAV